MDTTQTRESLGLRTAALCGAILAATVALRADSAGATQDPIDATRAALEKWVETRTLISQEKRDWAEGEELLAARIDLVQREIEALRAKTSEADTSVVETDKKRDELLRDNETLRDATQSLADMIASLEARTTTLLPRLPAPLQERVKLLSQRIPLDPAATKATLGERFQNVVGILNEVDKFNRDITVALEVRDLPEGGAMEVTTMYLGLGRAYYASANGAVAGFGAATADGWAWTPANDAAPAILAAIAVQANQAPAAFVQVPFRVE